jgi:hypothetical protein
MGGGDVEIGIALRCTLVPMRRSAVAPLLVVSVASCRAPTQITVEVSTDVPRSTLPVAIRVAASADLAEGADAAVSGDLASNNGDLGSIVLVPRGEKDDPLAIMVVAGPDGDLGGCAGRGTCIVARRKLRYLPHTPLLLPIALHASCKGVICPVDQTCVDGGGCRSSAVDPGACRDPSGCGEDALGLVGDGGPPSEAGVNDAADAGTDAPVGPTEYHDLTDTAHWSTYDIGAPAGSFAGATFDGRYVYFAPGSNDVTFNPSGYFARYDTQAPFAASASWIVLDASGPAQSSYARGFLGAAFDGRNVYFAPYNGGGTNDLVARYDTLSPLASTASWSTFATSTLSPAATSCFGAAFDTRYVYFVQAPGTPYGIIRRYDSLASFTTAASWAVFDTTTVNTNATGFTGWAFDGRYLYLAPWDSGIAHGPAARYDTQAPFGAATSWSTFDTKTLNATAGSFAGAAFDGRYVYFVPGSTGAGGVGLTARYDTQAPFTSSTSWTTFDVSALSAVTKGYRGAAFDGRFVYYISGLFSVVDGTILRYDTQAAFTDATSWKRFDATSLAAGGFFGAVFDGRYLYLVPHSGSVAARFDARTPQAIPKLPGFSGSFL